VDTKNAESLVRKCDIVLDVIDPESIIPIIALHRAGRKHNKYIIQPNDLGWGASVHIYSNKSKTIEEMLELDPHTPIEKIDPVIATSNYFKVGLEIMPEYAKAVLNDLLTGKIDHYPQPISAAYILSALSVMAAKRIALDLPVKVVPSFASFDPFDILDPDN